MKGFLIGLGKFLLTIISLVLCVVLFVSTLATMLVADVQVATNKDNLQKVISATLSQPVRRPGIINAASGSDPTLSGSSGGSLSDQLLDMALDIFADQLEGDLPITVEDVAAFVEESTFKDFIADKSASIISDIYTGEKTTTITAEEIGQLLTENKELINEHFSEVLPEGGLTDEFIEGVTNEIAELPVLKEINEQGVANIVVNGGLTGNPEHGPDGETGTPGINPPGFAANPVMQALDMVRTFTSTTVLMMLIGVCAVLVGLLFLCAWNNPHRAMFYSGTTIMSAGSIFLVPTLIVTLAPDTWMSLFSNIPGVGSMIGSVARIVLTLTASVCYTVTGIGLVLFIGAIVVCVALRKRRAAKAAAAAAAAVEATPVEEAPVAEEAAPAEEAPVAEEIPAE